MRASSQEPQDYDVYDSLTLDTSRMAPIRPDEMPALLSASAASNPSFFNGQGMQDGQERRPQMSSSGQPSYPGGYGSSQNVPSGNVANGTGESQPVLQQSNLEPYRRTNTYRRQQPEVPTFRRRPNPYANVPSLFDLYEQVAGRSQAVDRFGESIFINGTGNLERLPMDLPAGPDYVLGPGDGITVELWGSVAERLKRTVDREGRIALPEVGTVMVAGRTIGDAQRLVQSILRTQFRDIQADISLARIRTVRVYVVGDVQRPGAYDISSLSTPLNALYSAGGPTPAGSLRTLQHFRGTQMVQQIDVYDLLLHGVRSDLQRLQAGDTIRVPPLGPQVKIDGMVRRPAVYELNGEKNLSAVLELAGGVLSSGTLRHGVSYSNIIYRDGYTNNGNILGNAIGREGRGIQLWSTYWLSPQSKIRASYRHQGVNRDFLEGGQLDDVAVSANFRFRSGLEFSGSAQYERWNFPLLAPTTKSNVAVSVGITYWPTRNPLSK